MTDDLDSGAKRLRWARERMGVDQAAFAKAVGIKPVTYRAYENDQNGFAKRAPELAAALGVSSDWLIRGGPAPTTPPPSQIPEPNGVLAPPMEGASLARMARDVPVYGTALGGIEVIDGQAIEQTDLNTGAVVEYVKRPPILDGRADIYGLYIQGSSMAPRHEEGDTIFIERKRTPRVGDDVVVYLRPGDDSDDGVTASSVYIKRLIRTTAAYIELEQFTPAEIFKLPRERVLRVERVIPWRELIG